MTESARDTRPADDGRDPTDAWLVEASRDLDDTRDDDGGQEVSRLIAKISVNLDRVRRPARALATDSPRVLVSDRIVKQMIATRVRRTFARLVVFAAVAGDGDGVAAVRVGLIARYADDMPALSDDIRDIVDEVLDETLGPRSSAAARRHVHVRWQDVYTREWLD